MTKILYSPGFGSGWESWHGGSQEECEFMLRYQPLIDAVEAGEDIGFETGSSLRDRLKPGSPLAKFIEDFGKKFGEEAAQGLYLGGARDLAVIEVHGPFRINEYDGSETIEEFDPGHYYNFKDEPPKQLERGDEIDGEAEEIIV